MVWMTAWIVSVWYAHGQSIQCLWIIIYLWLNVRLVCISEGHKKKVLFSRLFCKIKKTNCIIQHIAWENNQRKWSVLLYKLGKCLSIKGKGCLSGNCLLMFGRSNRPPAYKCTFHLFDCKDVNLPIAIWHMCLCDCFNCSIFCNVWLYSCRVSLHWTFPIFNYLLGRLWILISYQWELVCMSKINPPLSITSPAMKSVGLMYFKSF